MNVAFGKIINYKNEWKLDSLEQYFMSDEKTKYYQSNKESMLTVCVSVI